MFVFDSFLYFRCEDGVTGPGVTWGHGLDPGGTVLLPGPHSGGAGLDPGPRFCALDHTWAGQSLTQGHGFAPWTTLGRGRV